MGRLYVKVVLNVICEVFFESFVGTDLGRLVVCHYTILVVRLFINNYMYIIIYKTYGILFSYMVKFLTTFAEDLIVFL